jgi:hypothetical protein
MSEIRAVEKLIEKLGKRGAQQFAKQEGVQLTEYTGETLWKKLMDREGKEARLANKPRPNEPVTGDEESAFAKAMAEDKPDAGKGGPVRDVTPRPEFGPDYDPDLATPIRVPRDPALTDAFNDDINKSLDTSAIPDLDLGLADKIKANKGKVATGAALAGGTAIWSMLPGAGGENAEAVAPPKEDKPVLPLYGKAGVGPISAEITPNSQTDSAHSRRAFSPAPVQKVKAEEEKLSDHWDKRIDQVQKYAKGLPPEQHSDWQAKYDALTKEMESAKERNQTGELIETIAQAVTQLAAGAYGLRTGMDLGGLKFSKTDWDKRMDQILSDFKAKKEIVSEGQQFEDKANARKFQAKESGQKMLSDALNDKAAAEERLGSQNANRRQDADKYNAEAGNKRTTDLLNADQQAARDEQQHQHRLAEIEASNKIKFDLVNGKTDTATGRAILKGIDKEISETEKSLDQLSKASATLNGTKVKDKELSTAGGIIAAAGDMSPEDLEKKVKENTPTGMGIIHTKGDDIANYKSEANNAFIKLKARLETLTKQKQNVNAGLQAAASGEFNKLGVTAPANAKVNIESTSGGQDPDAVKYAQMYNLPYEKAKAIIDKRKGIGQ